MKKVLIIFMSFVLALTLCSCSLVGEFISEKLMKISETSTVTPSTTTSAEPAKSSTTSKQNNVVSSSRTEPAISATTTEPTVSSSVNQQSSTSSTRVSTTATTSTTSRVTSTAEQLTVSLNKTSYTFVYGVTLSEIKAEIASHVVTNGSISYPTISTACGTQNVRLTISKGTQTEYKTISVTINANPQGFTADLSTSTQSWYWSNKTDTFTFNVYFKNNTGKAISSFDIDLAYGIDGTVRAASSFANNNLEHSLKKSQAP